LGKRVNHHVLWVNTIRDAGCDSQPGSQGAAHENPGRCSADQNVGHLRADGYQYKLTVSYGKWMKIDEQLAIFINDFQ